MPSEYLKDFIAKSSPETKAAFEQARQGLQNSGVEVAKNAPEQANTTPVAERADVKQIGQDLKSQGTELKQDSYGVQTPPKMGEPKPNAEPPKYMNEQSAEQGKSLQPEQKIQPHGQQNEPPVAAKKENAVDRANTPTTPPPAAQKSQDLER